jgi:hypothetical protein
MPEWALLGPGLGLFAVTYLSSVLAALELAGEADWLYAPVVGPLVLSADSTDEGQALLVALGICQAGGLGMMIAGLAINRRAGQTQPSVAAVPLVGPNLAGLAAAGRF